MRDKVQPVTPFPKVLDFITLQKFYKITIIYCSLRYRLKSYMSYTNIYAAYTTLDATNRNDLTMQIDSYTFIKR